MKSRHIISMILITWIKVCGQSQVDWFTFSKTYYSGTYDINNKFMGGTDVMYLTAHKGKLWAGISYWNDNPGSDSTPGPQILVKETSSSNWKLDTSMGTDYLRTDALYSFTFTKDKFGNTLPQPDTLLMAGFSDLVAPYDACIWVRNDRTGSWDKTIVYPNVPSADKSYIRHMYFYKDKVTGIEHVFAANVSAVVRGAYNPAIPGRIEWQGIEITGPQRMLSSAVCNGDYYVAFASDGDTTNNFGGIFRRNDGASPTWTFLYEWPDTGAVNLGTNLRGMTAVKDPLGGNHEVLVGIAENIKSVIRVDPVKNEHVVELDLQQFFESQWGSSITSFLYAAYNNTLKIIAPDNGDTCLLAGAWIIYPSAYGTVNQNNSWYLVRRPNGNWQYGQVIDALNIIPPGTGLQATRTIVKSPFSSEPFTYYFGGKDAGGPNPVFHNTAWIYKGKINKYTSAPKRESELPNDFALHHNYPNPFNPSTVITYHIPTAGHVTLKVYDVLGREVATLVDETQETGFHQSLFSTREHSLASGVYFYRLSAGSYTETKQMLVVK